jgi:multimeric flavodoxin WrbA
MTKKLKIAIIYSNARKGSTYNCVQIFKKALQTNNDVDYAEFTLPGAMPHICLGCFSCFEKGEDKCPHASSVQPIVNAILEADGVIISSPVYSLDASCAIKSLFDHMCYLWISHRPREEMFNKIAMVISTAAGTGNKTSIKTLKKNARYWGVKRIYGFDVALRAQRWELVSDEAKKKITARLTYNANRFIKAIMNKNRLKQRLSIRLLFPLMGKMIGGYKADCLLHLDTEYWTEKGWLNGGKPF